MKKPQAFKDRFPHTDLCYKARKEAPAFFRWAFDIEHSDYCKGMYDMRDLMDRWNERYGWLHPIKFPEDLFYDRRFTHFFYQMNKVRPIKQEDYPCNLQIVDLK